MYIEVENLSQALVALSKALVEKGIDVTRRGFKCTEIPGAVLICINNPTDRYCRVPERKWNKTLGWIESLWIARGDNSLEMPAAYVKNLLNFSDDKQFMRAGYGPRIRSYGNNDYVMIGSEDSHILRKQYANKGNSIIKTDAEVSRYTTDQLRFIIEKFKEDIDTREAVITIHDPIADDFDHSSSTTTILKTKDTPCTRSLHFMVVDGKMNMYVDMRSNDCFTFDTKIPLLNGEIWKIGDLAKQKANEEFWVYSRDENGNIVPGLAHHPRKIRTVQEIMQVTLDNGEIIECTPDHKFMLLDGSYKEIKDIELNESLSPLYRRYTDKGYEEIFYGNKWRTTHKTAYEAINGKKSHKMNVLHHKDFDKRNNMPENLVEMSWQDHINYHQELVGILNSKLWNPEDPEFDKYQLQREAILDALNIGNHNRWQTGDIIAKKEEQAKIMTAVNDYLWNHREGFKEFMKPIQQENGSKNLKALWQNEEFRKMVAEASSRRLSDPNVKTFLAKLTTERNIKNWQNPEYREHMSAVLKSQWTEDRKAKMSVIMRERSKKIWQDEEFIEMQRKIQKANTTKAWQNEDYRNQQQISRRQSKLNQILRVFNRMEENLDIFTQENYEKRRFELSEKFPSIEWVLKNFGTLESAKAALIGNHKIVAKKLIKRECDVYDISVDKYHNFALESGVFVHNCVWGFSAVNVFNFTLMQEYVAAMVGVPIGKYYHKADNLHVYEDFKPLVQEIANKYKVENFPSGAWFTYEPTYKNLLEFDKLLVMLSDFEEKCRKADNTNEQQYRDLFMFADNIVDPLFRDWAHVILRYWFKKPCEFLNPFLNELFNF